MPRRRLFAVSDIHTDEEANRRWCEGLSPTAFRDDGLILAGDVSEDVAQLEETLRLLTRKFGTVFFTPGNHDLWIDEDDADAGADSLGKLRAILQLADRLDVVTRPSRFGGDDGSAAVWVCPLLSFHHESFDTEPELQGWAVPPARDVMIDYRACRFPAHLGGVGDERAAAAVDALNDESARESSEAWGALASRPAAEPLVTFSHFLPRVELLPEKRFLTCPQLPKAAGSARLGRRVQTMAPDVHVFGHTHFAWDMTLDGVRYIQAALGYPTERRSRWHTLQVGEFGAQGPLLLWDSDAARGGGGGRAGIVPKLECRWSGYYEHHARAPQDHAFELASYAARYPTTDPRATVVDPDFSFDTKFGKAGMRVLATDPALPSR